MKVLLAGPILTSALASATGLDLTGLPEGITQTPLGPIAAGLLCAGHALHIVTLEPEIDDVQVFQRGALKITFCPYRDGKRFRARHRSRDLFAREIRYLTQAIAQSDADIVHAHWTYEFAEAALRSGKPALVTMHDLGWDYFFQFRDVYRLLRLVMKYRVMMRVKHLSVVGRFMLGKLWHYGFRGHAQVVPNPIEAAGWIMKDPARPCFVAVGNGNAIKNIGAAVAAHALLRQDFPQAELHLFGPDLGPDWPGITGRPGVIGHGNVAHGALMAFLRDHATVLIHPSRLETFGVILGEAKMRGVPVVAGRCAGGTRDVVGESGRLVDIANPAAIAGAVRDILAQADAFHHLQQASHADITHRFPVAAIVQAYVQIYEQILSFRANDRPHWKAL